MDKGRVDRVMQLAVAAARCVHDDDPYLRPLGPIHLIKYVYVADLSYAREGGLTFTGTPWVFWHFGPFSVEVSVRTEPAMRAIAAPSSSFASRYGDDDILRWTIPEYDAAQELRGELHRELPVSVTSAVESAVRSFGCVTEDLLRHVYGTDPMLHAAPGEVLRFDAKPIADARPELERASLRAKAVKTRKQMIAEARERVSNKAKERVARRKKQREAFRPPQYDEVFEEGLRQLDELGGAPLERTAVSVDDTVWKSPARTGDDD